MDWPIITLGIYFFVWYYKIHKEMAQFDRRRVETVAGPMLVMLFLGWLAIPAWISFYNTGTRIAAAQRAAGMPASCNPLVGLLLWFAFGLGVLYYQSELNKVISIHPNTPEGTRGAALRVGGTHPETSGYWGWDSNPRPRDYESPRLSTATESSAGSGERKLSTFRVTVPRLWPLGRGRGLCL
jgi:Domain of unknown function (DUF4234)